MAVYRKKLVDKDGNTIIPAIGDIYGPVYTASLSSASGGIATYTFTPDTPVENSRVYAVKFPTPTVNNATIILGDGTTSASVLVPPVAATDSPNYELLDTTMINDTEPLLLMYNGVQWVCLNQKRSVSSGDIDWTTIGALNYSTSEVSTGGTWIDGKTIYKKTVHFGSLPNNGNRSVAHGISNLGDVIKIEAIAKYTNGSFWVLPLVMRGNEVNYQTVLNIGATDIYMANLADRSSFDAYITIYYTKSN